MTLKADIKYTANLPKKREYYKNKLNRFLLSHTLFSCDYNKPSLSYATYQIPLFLNTL